MARVYYRSWRKVKVLHGPPWAGKRLAWSLSVLRGGIKGLQTYLGNLFFYILDCKNFFFIILYAFLIFYNIRCLLQEYDSYLFNASVASLDCAL